MNELNEKYGKICGKAKKESGEKWLNLNLEF